MDDPIYKTKFQILYITNDLVWGYVYVWWGGWGESDLVEVSVIVAERSKTG